MSFWNLEVLDTEAGGADYLYTLSEGINTSAVIWGNSAGVSWHAYLYRDTHLFTVLFGAEPQKEATHLACHCF